MHVPGLFSVLTWVGHPEHLLFTLTRVSVTEEQSFLEGGAAQ